MNQVRGNALASAVADIRKRMGEKGLQDILAAMKPENAKVLSGGLVRNAWYPFDAYLDFCINGDRVHGKGDYSHARLTARAAAEADLGLFLKVIVMVFTTPAELVRRIPSIWPKYYDSGEIVVTADQPPRIKLELRNFPSPHALHCEMLSGWLERFFELTVSRKGKAARCTHPQCRTRGAPVCEFVVDIE